MADAVDLEAARLLLLIEESGSLGAAARRIGISQPAASARLRAFETRWRLTLVERSPRGSRLTDDGLAVASWARAVWHEVDTMLAGLVALKGARGADLAIAASLTLAEYVVPRWLAELRGRRPEVRPHLHVVNSERVVDLVRDGTAGVGFIETAARPVDLRSRPVGRDRLVVLTTPDHPWARRRTALTRSQLVKEAWVLREVGSGTRSTFESALRAQPRLALEAGSTTALLGAALAGVGPAVVSGRAAKAPVETGRLVVIPTELDLSRPFLALWSSTRRLPDPAQDLLVIAAESLRGEELRA
jgi:DNA-binding transcriptional LysR family regulator